MSLRLSIFATLMSATAAFAQVAAPGGPAAPAAPGARALPPAPLPYGAAAPMPPAAPVAADSTATGTVVQFLLNPNGDADGLLLNDGTQVAFPPHVGDAVGQSVKPGDTVQVSGWRAPGVPVLRMQTLSANGRSITDQPPQPGVAPRPRAADTGLSQLSASGRIERLLYNDRGDVHGVVLSDRTVVRFPPHVAAAMQTELKTGASLKVQGWGARTAQGTSLEATAVAGSNGELRPLETSPRPRRPL